LVKVIHEIQDSPTKRSPVVLALGFFDGLHLGHQDIFKKMRELRGEKGLAYILTFSNHPRTLINPDLPFPLILTFQDRIERLKDQGCDTIILLEFTEQIKKASADEFLSHLQEQIGFDHLILGPDATIGNNREGSTDLMKLLSKKFSYELHIIPTVSIQNERVSSTRVREAINRGDLKEVEILLGRPYSIRSSKQEGKQIGRALGFPTVNLEVSDIVLPPLGVYKVRVTFDGETYLGAANLGFAPTLQERTLPILEIHLVDYHDEINSSLFEVTFLNFIREEKKFSSQEALKRQIELDIEAIRA
jgi:riboflavin kinase/FMN adenylyltransferase